MTPPPKDLIAYLLFLETIKYCMDISLSYEQSHQNFAQLNQKLEFVKSPKKYWLPGSENCVLPKSF